MYIFFILFFSVSAFAQKGHIYASPLLDFTKKQLVLSLIANTAQSEHLGSIELVSPLNIKEQIKLDFEIKPGKTKTIVIDLKDPQKTLGWKIDSSLANSLLVIAPLVIEFPSPSPSIPRAWKVIGNKLIVPPGSYFIEGLLNLQSYSSVEFNHVILLMGKNSSIEIKGDVKATQLKIKPKDPQYNWSNFIVYGYGATGQWDQVSIIGGQNGIQRDLAHSCSLCVYGGTHKFNELSILQSGAEDGLNIKEGIVTISKSRFVKSFSDSFDCDWCTLDISHSSFEAPGGDGLDVSGTKGKAVNVKITHAFDKAISIGESSYFVVEQSEIQNGSIGIAIKDMSEATIIKTLFKGNKTDIAVYQKKSIWGSGKVILKSNTFSSKNIEADSKAVINEF